MPKEIYLKSLQKEKRKNTADNTNVFPIQIYMKTSIIINQSTKNYTKAQEHAEVVPAAVRTEVVPDSGGTL